MDAMKAKGVQTSIHYPPVHFFETFQGCAQEGLELTEDIAMREVTLPLYPTLKDKDVSY